MSESTLVKGILSYLQLLENQGKLIVMRNNTGAFVSHYKNQCGRIKTRFVRFGKKGSPDILIWCQKRSIFLECKSEKGKQTRAQKDFQKKAKQIGVEYYIVRDINEVEKIFKKVL